MSGFYQDPLEDLAAFAAEDMAELLGSSPSSMTLMNDLYSSNLPQDKIVNGHAWEKEYLALFITFGETEPTIVSMSPTDELFLVFHEDLGWNTSIFTIPLNGGEQALHNYIDQLLAGRGEKRRVLIVVYKGHGFTLQEMFFMASHAGHQPIPIGPVMKKLKYAEDEVLLIIDACYSGAAVKEAQKIVPDPEHRLLEPRQMDVIASCGAEEYSYGGLSNKLLPYQFWRAALTGKTFRLSTFSSFSNELILNREKGGCYASLWDASDHDKEVNMITVKSPDITAVDEACDEEEVCCQEMILKENNYVYDGIHTCRPFLRTRR